MTIWPSCSRSRAEPSRTCQAKSARWVPATSASRRRRASWACAGRLWPFKSARTRPMRATAWAWLAGCGLLPYALYGCASAPPPPAPPPPASAGVVVVVVLLPDDAGQVGRITLSSPQGTQELSRAREAVRVSTADPALPAPVAMDSEYITRVFGAALAAQPGPPARFVLFFEDDS